MRNHPRLLSMALAVCIGSVAASTVQARDEEEIGFIFNKIFSTFIAVDGVMVLDVFDLVGLKMEKVFFSDDDDFFLLPPGNSEFKALVSKFGLPGNNRFEYIYNPDPFVAFELVVLNSESTPVEIIYDMTVPIVPVTGPTHVVSQLSIDLVDADGDGSASVTLNTFDSSIQQVGVLEGGIFGAFTDSGLGVGIEVTSAGQTMFAPAIAAGPEAGVAWDHLFVAGRLILSPGDQVTLTGVGGIAEVGDFLPELTNFDFAHFPAAPVPEPSSGVLILLGLYRFRRVLA